MGAISNAGRPFCLRAIERERNAVSEQLEDIQRRLELIEVLAERINLGIDILVDAQADNFVRENKSSRERETK